MTRKRKTTRKKATRRKARVKHSSCRTAGHQLKSKNRTMRKVGAKKLGSKSCKTRAQIKKSTAKITRISKTAKRIRKKNESWASAMRRAAKAV